MRGLFSGVYAAGIPVAALLWGVLSNRVGRSRVLIIGLIGYLASLPLLLTPTLAGLWGLHVVHAANGFFVAAVVPMVSAPVHMRDLHAVINAADHQAFSAPVKLNASPM